MAIANAGPWQSGFLSGFFALIGTHGAHVSFGLVWIVLLGCEIALRGIPPSPPRAFTAWACSGISSLSSGSTSSHSFTCPGFSSMAAAPQSSERSNVYVAGMSR